MSSFLVFWWKAILKRRYFVWTRDSFFISCYFFELWPSVLLFFEQNIWKKKLKKMAGVWKKKQWKCKSQNPADRFAWGPNDRLNIYWRAKYFIYNKIASADLEKLNSCLRHFFKKSRNFIFFFKFSIFLAHQGFVLLFNLFNSIPYI